VRRFGKRIIEELALSIEIDPKALRETVECYNGYCKAGVDSEFGKPAEFLLPVNHAPYYAIYGQRFSEGSFGGLRVNGKTEVTREDGTVIPGLYGTGDATSAMHRKKELAVITELTWATASTFLAGCNAADFVDCLRKGV
jgi:succinate dehydrogenase/fumarate reductase flavoprotein subunit